MMLEVKKVNESDTKVVASLEIAKVPGNVHNLHLVYGEAIWIETELGMVRVAMYDRISVALYAPKGSEVELDKARGVKVVKRPK